MTRLLIPKTLALVAGGVLCAAAGASGSPTVPPCRTADLAARIVPGSPGAGQRYAMLELTNRSSHSCHTYGYIGLGLLDAAGRPLPTDADRQAAPRPHRVVLGPGRHASALLHWSVIPGIGDGTGPCVSAPRQVLITPPDERSHLVLRWSGGTVCERGQIDVSALER